VNEATAEPSPSAVMAKKARRASDASFKALVRGVDYLDNVVTEAIEALREHTSSRPPPAQPSG
jgi:hypothetical protein